MTDMKCPICGSKMSVSYGSGEELFSCSNLSCKAGGFYATDNTWKDLICTHKELEQSETCCSDWEKQALDYKAENIALSGELERTRKALDVAVDALKSAKTRLELINNSKFANLNNVLQIQSQCEVLKINKALEQITALEQKDK